MKISDRFSAEAPPRQEFIIDGQKAVRGHGRETATLVDILGFQKPDAFSAVLKTLAAAPAPNLFRAGQVRVSPEFANVIMDAMIAAMSDQTGIPTHVLGMIGCSDDTHPLAAKIAQSSNVIACLMLSQHLTGQWQAPSLSHLPRSAASPIEDGKAVVSRWVGPGASNVEFVIETLPDRSATLCYTVEKGGAA